MSRCCPCFSQTKEVLTNKASKHKMSSAIKYAKLVLKAKAPKATAPMTQEMIIALLTSQASISNWRDLIDEDPVDPAQAAAWLAESHAIQAQKAAERAAHALTPEGHVEAVAAHRATVSKFLLHHIQYNISRSKAVQGRKIKPVWRILYGNQCDHQASAQEVLDARSDSMWDWIRAQKEYQEQTEEEFEALGMGWESYWEEKYEAYLAEVLPGNLHRDPTTGEVEICRFFSLPGGCRPKPGGGACPYRHVAGAAQEVCRFFNTPRGCRSGDACPYAHTAPAAGTVAGGLDFAAARAGGPSWRLPNAATATASASASASNSSRRSSVSTEASADGWMTAGTRRFTPAAASPAASFGSGSRPPLAPQRSAAAGGGGGSAAPAECRFFRSPRGCKNGASCPFKH